MKVRDVKTLGDKIVVQGGTFLNKAEKEGRVINVSFELPKSFVVCLEEGKIIIYISQLSTATLEKRAENFKSILV